jgi:uncharacterized protein (TIGR03083 family)
LPSTMELARAEREEFAVLLDQLSQDQWNSPTLCHLWRVRDVVAHVFSYDELSPRELVRRFLKGRLGVDRINALGVADHADKSPAQLTALMRGHTEPRGLAAGFGGMIALVDGMIHQQDIRRALDTPRTIEPQRLTAALKFARYAPTIRGAWRARGVRLVATDVDWSHGSGPEVRGGCEALLMAMAGRRDALCDLTGPGKAKLAQRL